MTLDEAGRLQEAWKTKHGDHPCLHTRVVDHLTAQNEQPTGELVCRECGFIYPDPTNLPTSAPPQL